MSNLNNTIIYELLINEIESGNLTEQQGLALSQDLEKAYEYFQKEIH